MIPVQQLPGAAAMWIAVSLVGMTLLMLAPAWSQTSTGTVTGTVTDQSGAAVPGATVNITNQGTNHVETAETNTSGYYVAPLLPSGEYTISVEKNGFRKAVRTSVKLNVAQQPEIDFVLETGIVSEAISVAASAPLIDATTASLGQVVDNRRVDDLPLNARSVIQFVALSPGLFPNPDRFTQIQGDSSISPSYFSANGAGDMQNQVLIDGAPDTGGSDGQIHVYPTVDAVQEFKVMTHNYSAEFGDTAGAVVNMVIKSGTNRVSGDLWEFFRHEDLNANNFFSNRSGLPRGLYRLNQFGGTLGGPVYLPKIYNGRNKSFFFFSYEGTRRLVGGGGTAVSGGGITPLFETVPTQAQRSGDFSNLRNTQGALIPIYDPATTTLDPASGQYLRTPFPNNVIPLARENPTSAKLINFYPAPNTIPSNPFTQANNFVSLNPSHLNAYQIQVKGDHYFTERNVATFRYGQNTSNNSPSNEFNNIASPDQPPLEFRGQNGMVQDTHTFNATTILVVRGGLSRLPTYRSVNGVDLQALGFPPDLPSIAFPIISVSGLASLGTPSGALISRSANSYSLQASLNKIVGNHSIKFGIDFRVQQNNVYMPAAPAGQFSFLPNFTQGPTTSTAYSGSALAAFFLGTISSGTFAADLAYAASQPYYSGYVQDDWRVTRRLTLNLGLRYDLNLPRTERYNRLLNFDPSLINPVTNTPGVFQIPGRTIATRGEYDTDPHGFGPRLGLAYQLTPKTVIRAGGGIMYISVFNEGDGDTNIGISPTFSLSGQNAQVSAVLPQVYINNPFPQGVTPPVGASLGNGTLVGQSGYFVARHDPTPYMIEWNFSIQRQFGQNFLIEASYIGSEGKRLFSSVPLNIDSLAPQYLAMGNALSQQVPNPFFGKITSGPISTPTIPLGQTLLPYPQFTAVYQTAARDFMSNFQSMELRAEKRMSHGFTILAAYMLTKLITNAEIWGTDGTYQNIYNRAADKGLSSTDFPSRFVTSYLYELPFGARKRFLASGVAGLLVGGWQVGGITTLQTGNPFGITAAGASPYLTGVWHPDVVGDPTLPSNQRSIAEWFNRSAFVFPANSFTFGDGPRTLPRTLRPGIENFDFTITKMTRIQEKMNVQFRAEFFNGFNHTNLLGPGTTLGLATFGQISSAREGRDIQFGLKILF